MGVIEGGKGTDTHKCFGANTNGRNATCIMNVGYGVRCCHEIASPLKTKIYYKSIRPARPREEGGVNFMFMT